MSSRSTSVSVCCLSDVHGQQLFAEVRVLLVLVDVGLALGDGFIEQHQFFFVRDHERRLRVVELLLGHAFQALDGLEVRLLGALHFIESRDAEDVAVERGVVTLDAHGVEDRAAEADGEKQTGGDLPQPLRARRRLRCSSFSARSMRGQSRSLRHVSRIERAVSAISFHAASRSAHAAHDSACRAAVSMARGEASKRRSSSWSQVMVMGSLLPPLLLQFLLRGEEDPLRVPFGDAEDRRRSRRG